MTSSPSLRSTPRRSGAALVLALLATACSVVAGCGAGTTPETSGAAHVLPASAIGATVLHRDARSGRPSFVWFGGGGLASSLSSPAAPHRRFASVDEAARALAPELARVFELPTKVGESLALVAPLRASSGGAVVLRYAQRASGLEVFRAGANVVLGEDLAPVSASGGFATSLVGADAPFVLDEGAAAEAAFAVVAKTGARLARATSTSQGGYELFIGPGLAAPVRVKRVLFPLRAAAADDAVAGSLGVVPAFYAEVQVARGPSRSLVLAADDGRVLFTNDLVRHDAFTYRVWGDAETQSPLDGPQGNGFSPHPTGKPDRIKLTYVPSQLVTLESRPFTKNDPWLPAGATETTGNNVDAYADLGGADGFSGPPDLRAQATAPGVFDHAYDTAKSPGVDAEAQQASVTHLFFVLNSLHDVFYDAGFDEKAGNHQADNFGRGGKGGDRLLGEAQDFSGRNNANAAVPADGASPRIQMFIFSGASTSELVVNAPAGLAGTKAVGIAPTFGADVFDVTGDVVLASDGQGADVADACEPLDVDVQGKIVLAHRGLCSFAQKAQNAQAAGAVGVVIANVASSTSPTVPPYMGGTANGITVPLLSLALADGQALEAAAGSGGASVRMHRTVGADLDGGLDTSIVAHEWGHVLSGRLVGDGNGLTTNQAGGLGEGWGDFTALLFGARPGPGESGEALLGGVYANGSYATSGSGDDIYFGTRRVPYSVDFTKSPLTFKHIQNGVALPTTAPISFGEVWASMLWECYVALARDPRYTFADAQARMRRYLVASLAATPVDPTLLEARDALLSVAYGTDPRDFQTFFDAFARRGAGAGAKGPPKDSSSNAGVVESFTSAGALEVVSATLTDDVLSCDHDGILDDGETGSLTVQVKNVGSTTLEGATLSLAPAAQAISLLDDTLAAVPPLLPFQGAKIVLKTRVVGAPPTVPVDVVATLGGPSLPAPVKVVVTARYDSDEAPESATQDTVETAKTSWKVRSKGDFGEAPWSRVKEPGANNTFWTVPDPVEASDMRLTSAPFTIEGTTFTLSFRHKWSFRISRRRETAIDGGVVEISTDGGASWTDAVKLGKVGYNVTLDTAGRGDNILKGRQAFGETSPGYPDAWVPAKFDVTLPSAPESVLIRFRVGTGSGFTAADGWFIDDIGIDRATSKPFFGFVPHQDLCDPRGPTADAGPARTVRSGEVVTLTGSGTHPDNAPLSWVWTQKIGPEVGLSGSDTSVASFLAPAVTGPTVLGFVLRANDGKLVSPASRVEITVVPADAGSGDDGCSCRAAGGLGGRGAEARLASLAGLGTALAGLAARRRRRPRA
jgi:hypothetical protein